MFTLNKIFIHQEQFNLSEKSLAIMLTLNRIRNNNSNVPARGREMLRSKIPPVDREKVCPFLVRVFWRENDLVPMEQYKQLDAQKRDDEVRIYTWYVMRVVWCLTLYTLPPFLSFSNQERRHTARSARADKTRIGGSAKEGFAL